MNVDSTLEHHARSGFFELHYIAKSIRRCLTAEASRGLLSRLLLYAGWTTVILFYSRYCLQRLHSV